MSIHDYASAAEYLGKKTDRPLPGRASRLQRRDEASIAVRYQRTDVVTYHVDGSAVLNSDGWQTVTTKARFSEYTRATIYSIKGQWFVRMGAWENPASLYYDGIRIGVDGLPVEPRYPTQTDATRKRELDKLTRNYIKGFAAHIAEHGLENPGAGDCFGCAFYVVDEPTVTQGSFRRQRAVTPHGRVEPLGIGHYLEHMKEGYFVPLLLFNAIKAAGYRDPAFIWRTIQQGKNADMAARILRRYFSNMKPALLVAMTEAQS